MKAVVCEGFTGPGELVVRDFEAPEPAPDEVLIEVFAATVNFMDHLIVSGLYQMNGTSVVKYNSESITGLGLSFSLRCACRAPGRHAIYFQLE